MPSSIPIKIIVVNRCARMRPSPEADSENALFRFVRKPSSHPASPQSEKGRVVGLGRNDRDRHDRLGTGALNVECLDYPGEDQDRLSQRELLADADARADAERQIRKTIRRRRAGQKPCRIEPLRFWP